MTNARRAIEMLAEHVRDLTAQLVTERAATVTISDDQIREALEALKRIGTRDELGSDALVIEATIKGASLDDDAKASESFGVPEALAVKS